jgi:biopolymer transport protein ExbB
VKRSRIPAFLVALVLLASGASGASGASRQNAALERELHAEQEELRIAEEALALAASLAESRKRALDAELQAANTRLGQLATEKTSPGETDERGEKGAMPEHLDLDAALPGARALLEQLDLQLREIPGGEASRARLNTLSLQLDEPEKRADALAQLAAFSAELHASTTSVTLQRTTLWSARNVREEVELLSTGTVAHAYRAGDGRLAIAVLAPDEASGFRWTEDLDPQTRAALARAFDQVSAGASSPMIPVDPVTSLRSATGGERTLGDQFGDGGPVMWPLALIALVALLLMLERVVTLFVFNRRDPLLLDEVLKRNARGEFAAAQELCKHRRGVVARTLAAVLRRREHGQEAMEDTVQEQMLHELPRLQRFLSGIALLGGIAPLLGLLGTVTGIIDTFRVIHAFGNSDASMMAGGIAEALTTTATGLIIAVPIFVVHGLLKGRADRIVSDAERSAATLLNEVVRPLAPSSGASRGEAVVERTGMLRAAEPEAAT